MTKWDKILVIAMIVVSLTSMIYIRNLASNKGENYISVQVNGERYKKILFPIDNTKRYLDIDTIYGYNRLEIQRDKVRVVDADCPDKLDVKEGYISKQGEMLVCLPNRLVIEIRGEDTDKLDKKIDAGSY